MAEMEITREDVAGRAKVHKLAVDDPKGAVALALRIKHPWYRCQALSCAAEQMAGSERQKWLLKALEVAREQSEANRIVTVSSWPIRVLGGSSPSIAAQHVAELVGLAETEPHTLRRAHALQALAFSVADHPGLLELVVPTLVEALLSGHGWRIDRCIRDTFEMVRRARPDLLRGVALHHKPNRQQKRLLESI